MRVVGVLNAQRQVRYAVVDDGGDRVDVIGAYLQHLDDRGYARNTLKAYARGLCLYLRFLAEAGADYRTIGVAERAAFVASLKSPGSSSPPAGATPVPPAQRPHRQPVPGRGHRL